MGLREVDDAGRPCVQTLDGPTVAVEIDLAIFSIPAILRACYHFTDRCFVFVHRSGAEAVTVFLQTKSPELQGAIAAGEFSNRLVDEQLRVTIAAETGAIRELVVAQAFAEGNLLDESRDEGDYQTDPLGIGQRS